MMIDLTHILTETLTVGTPILLYMWANKRSAKKDAQERAQKTDQLVNGLVVERKYFPSHAHQEKDGPLTAERIEYPPRDT